MLNLFSYGTLQKKEVQMETFGRILIGQKDILVGYNIEMIEITDKEVLKKSGQKFHPIIVFTNKPNDKVEQTREIIRASIQSLHSESSIQTV